MAEHQKKHTIWVKDVAVLPSECGAPSPDLGVGVNSRALTQQRYIRWFVSYSGSAEMRPKVNTGVPLAQPQKLCYRNAVVPSEQAYRRFQRRVDRLSFLIVATDISERDINIERLFLRTEAARLFPERFRFYEMVHESRFQRLVDQFRRDR